MNDPEAASEKFKRVQMAYEVLSDKNERAWYDDHRISILAEQNGTEEHVPVLWKYFGPCYSEFDDSDNGFYKVYEKVFEEINTVENKYIAKSVGAIKFGSSTSTHDEVRLFYNSWEGFTTKANFAWCDLANPNEQGESRAYRRHVKKLNEKAREKERKEYTKCVRRLVGFVKKRDPRMIQILKEASEQRLEQARQREKEKARKIEERQQSQMELRKQFQEELKIREQEEVEMGEKYFKLADEDEKEVEEAKIFRCKPCRKTFKTEKQFENHQQSKKHKANVKKKGVK